MGRNHLAHRAGDAANAVLATVGYNFRLLLAWLALQRLLLATALAQISPSNTRSITAQTA